MKGNLEVKKTQLSLIKPCTMQWQVMKNNQDFDLFWKNPFISKFFFVLISNLVERTI